MNTNRASSPGIHMAIWRPVWCLAILVLASNLVAQTPARGLDSPGNDLCDDTENVRPVAPAPRPAAAGKTVERAVWHVSFNLRRGPTTDRAVRHRIATAVHRTTSPTTPPARLRRAGFDGPYELLVAAGCAHHDQRATAISARLHASGIGVRIRKADEADYKRLLASGEYDLALGRTQPAPPAVWTTLASRVQPPRKNQTTARPASLSGTLFALAALREQARVQTGPAPRRQLDRKIQELMQREVLLVVLPAGS